MKKAIFLPIFLMIGLMSNAWGESCGWHGWYRFEKYWRDDSNFVYYGCVNAERSKSAKMIDMCENDRCDGKAISLTNGGGKQLCVMPGNPYDDTTPGYVDVRNLDLVCLVTKHGLENQQAERVCEDSHGSWESGRCTCDAQLGLSYRGSDAKECTCGSKIWSTSSRMCVENTDKNNCESTGGTWDGQKCTCSHGDLEQDGDKKCKCRRGNTYKWGGNQCVTVAGGYTYAEVAASAERSRQTANERSASCSNSGGSYANKRCNCSAPNTRVQNYACLCQSGYRWKNENDKSQGCVMTNETAYETACDAAVQKGQARKNTYPSLSCVCNDGGYELDVNAGECKPTVERAACDMLTQQNKARWNTAQKACVCSQTGYEFDGNSCVETAEGAATRKANELATAKAKIENVHSKLKKTQDGFKVSAWKNEDGNFNTARLASDSIAGVVVGTAGGLLTSKIVKKNQVEDGFEDIQCTIGGQTVAGWGDEFSVGNQM